ncbi:MAG: TRAP transporter substrate-binding protein [Alphaproteobacteria bacterium]|nr:TRAP transporter substrate-binding protein [Alphaproteobacteria bacterium]
MRAYAQTRRSLFLLMVFAVCLGLFALAGCSNAGDEGALEPAAEAPKKEPTVRWKMSSAYTSTTPQIGTLAVRLASQMETVSGGDIAVTFYEPGALVPPLEAFEAVSEGALEAAWSTPGYWAGKAPALQLFSAIPFGMRSDEYMSWFYFGGGKEIFDDIYHRYGIHSVMCGMIAPEASGWFKVKIEKPEDFKNLKIRFFGLGGRVLEKLGANTQLLAAGDIFPALELGTIDGTEFSMPAIDINLGFYQAAKHYYFPGWHQQSTFFDLMINLEEWNSLNETQRAQIEAVCGDNMRYSIAEGEAIQSDALKQLADKGVQIHQWPPEVLDALKAAWREVAADLAEENEDFRRAYTSFREFREKHERWRELGYLP